MRRSFPKLADEATMASPTNRGKDVLESSSVEATTRYGRHSLSICQGADFFAPVDPRVKPEDDGVGEAAAKTESRGLRSSLSRSQQLLLPIGT